MKRSLFVLFFPATLLVYNICYGDIEHFFSAPLYVIINMVIAIIFAFYLTQQLANRRRNVDHISNTINRMIKGLEDSRMYHFNTQSGDTSYGYIEHSLLLSRLKLLDGSKEKLKYENEIARVRDSVRSWWGIFSETMCNERLSRESEKSLRYHVTLAISALEEIQLKIHS